MILPEPALREALRDKQAARSAQADAQVVRVVPVAKRARTGSCAPGSQSPGLQSGSFAPGFRLPK